MLNEGEWLQKNAVDRGDFEGADEIGEGNERLREEITRLNQEIQDLADKLIDENRGGNGG
jgi:hypothetical protein